MKLPGAEPLGRGAAFARWTIVRTLGQGPLGRIYLAEADSGPPVALKVLLPATSTVELDVSRFDREVESLGRLVHPAIVGLLASGWHEGTPYIATEYIDGHDLAQAMALQARWPERRAAQLATRVAEALAHAHRAGVVHRDIKPSNILLEQGDASLARLVDFGISSMEDAYRSHTGLFAGTPGYMAPEQLLGARATAQADLYALGVVLYELLTGVRPHRADSLGELLRRVAQEAPEPVDRQRPGLSPDLTLLIGDLLLPDPAARPADAAAVARTLMTIARTTPADSDR